MTRINAFHSFFAAVAVSLFVAGVQAQQLPNRADPLEGITTSGQPDAEALEQLAIQGYTTIIDLRGPDEDRTFDEPAAVEELGMDYISLPVVGAGGVTFENAALLDRLLSEAAGPVLLHCSSGNRSGALLALRAKLNGADDDAALALGRGAGLTRLESVVVERLAER